MAGNTERHHMHARRTKEQVRGAWAALRAAMLGLAVFAWGAVALSGQSNRISVGDDYGAVIDAAGAMFLWGAMLEDGTGGIEPVAGTWREVSVSKTAATEAHILAIAADGTLWAWGNNNRGQLGAGDQVDRAEPVRISAQTSWVEVAAGARHSMARRADGSIYVWGDNTYGQLIYLPRRACGRCCRRWPLIVTATLRSRRVMHMRTRSGAMAAYGPGARR